MSLGDSKARHTWAAASALCAPLVLQNAHSARTRAPAFVHARTGLVLFLSDAVLHRVMPSTARRYCFTIWLDGEGTNTPASLRLDSRVAPTSLDALDPCTRQLTRAVYADEYAASIRDTFAASPEQGALILASHEQHVASSMANPAFAKLVHAARAAIREREVQAHEHAAAQPPAPPAEARALGQGAPCDEAASPTLAVALRVRALTADRGLASIRVVAL